MGRCPFDFGMTCSRACEWHDEEYKRCKIPLAIINLTDSVKANNQIMLGVAGSLRSIIKERKNDFSK